MAPGFSLFNCYFKSGFIWHIDLLTGSTSTCFRIRDTVFKEMVIGRYFRIHYQNEFTNGPRAILCFSEKVFDGISMTIYVAIYIMQIIILYKYIQTYYSRVPNV